MNIISGFVKFNRGLLRVRLAVQLWILWLVVVNVGGAIYFMPRIEAIVALVSFSLGGMAMCALTASKGFTRILGLGHLLWLPGMLYLLNRLLQLGLDSPSGLWLVVLLASNFIALLFDAYDVWRYWRGDRAEMVQVS